MRMLLSTLSLWWILVAAPDALAAQEPVTVAVLDFDAFSLTLDDASAVGKGVAGMLTTELDARPGLRVIERDRLRQLLDEQGLSLSGRVDPATAVEVGRMAGAQYMITGTVALADEARLDVRVFSVETSEILRTEKLTRGTDEFLGMVVAVADAFAADLDLETAARADAEPETVPVRATLAYSRGLAYEDAGEPERAIEMYREALELFGGYRAARTALERLTGEGSGR